MFHFLLDASKIYILDRNELMSHTWQQAFLNCQDDLMSRSKYEDSFKRRNTFDSLISFLLVSIGVVGLVIIAVILINHIRWTPLVPVFAILTFILMWLGRYLYFRRAAYLLTIANERTKCYLRKWPDIVTMAERAKIGDVPPEPHGTIEEDSMKSFLSEVVQSMLARRQRKQAIEDEAAALVAEIKPTEQTAKVETLVRQTAEAEAPEEQAPETDVSPYTTFTLKPEPRADSKPTRVKVKVRPVRTDTSVEDATLLAEEDTLEAAEEDALEAAEEGTTPFVDAPETPVYDEDNLWSDVRAKVFSEDATWAGTSADEPEAPKEPMDGTYEEILAAVWKEIREERESLDEVERKLIILEAFSL